MLASRDDGKTFQNETHRLVWGTFFFLADDMKKHIRSDYNLISLLGDIGGLIEAMYVVIYFIPFMFNNLSLENKQMRLLYYDKQPDSTV